MALQQQALIGKLKPKVVKKTAHGIPQSLWDAIIEDPDRFCKDLKFNRRIVDFGTFIQEANKIYSFGKQSNAKEYFVNDIDRELYKILFNSRTIKETIVRNVGQAEADKIYAKPLSAPTQTTLPKPQSQFTVTFQSKGYKTKKGKDVQPYIRTKPLKFNPAQSKFLKVRRQGKQPLKKALADYRATFSADMRTNSSIKTKFYRS